MTDRERIAQLEKDIVDLQARLPKHSTPAAMLIQLEDLEDELAALQARHAHGAGRDLDVWPHRRHIRPALLSTNGKK